MQVSVYGSGRLISPVSCYLAPPLADREITSPARLLALLALGAAQVPVFIEEG